MNRAQWDAQRLAERDQYGNDMMSLAEQYRKGQEQSAKSLPKGWGGKTSDDGMQQIREFVTGIWNI